ncbi:hypothetical protein NQ317_010687 [Molorchus minor]|uniref:THAP-type domain-containing protein n=1 Tax=Molorchus minor TaxID=1323400 RepID=A0ABQ9K5Q9_9CUCU|nr:hypothetical protein NQ317_010687 [Molorchus minor]
MNSSYYKYCLVPQCKSTTIKTPNKLFIYVPNNEQIRKKWLKLARRDDVHSLSTNLRMQIILITCNFNHQPPTKKKKTGKCSYYYAFFPFFKAGIEDRNYSVNNIEKSGISSTPWN